jgi:hypothetical protein
MVMHDVLANFAPHFAPSPAFVRLLRNSKPQYQWGIGGGFSKRLERDVSFFGTPSMSSVYASKLRSIQAFFSWT